MARGRFTWTAEEIQLLRAAYEAAAGGNIGIDALSVKLGRLKSNVSRKAWVIDQIAPKINFPDFDTWVQSGHAT